MLLKELLKARPLDISAIKSCINDDPKQLNQPGLLGRYPIHQAVIFGEDELVAFILEKAPEQIFKLVKTKTPIDFVDKKQNPDLYFFLENQQKQFLAEHHNYYADEIVENGFSLDWASHQQIPVNYEPKSYNTGIEQSPSISSHESFDSDSNLHSHHSDSILFSQNKPPSMESQRSNTSEGLTGAKTETKNSAKLHERLRRLSIAKKPLIATDDIFSPPVYDTKTSSRGSISSEASDEKSGDPKNISLVEALQSDLPDNLPFQEYLTDKYTLENPTETITTYVMQNNLPGVKARLNGKKNRAPNDTPAGLGFLKRPHAIVAFLKGNYEVLCYLLHNGASLEQVYERGGSSVNIENENLNEPAKQAILQKLKENYPKEVIISEQKYRNKLLTHKNKIEKIFMAETIRLYINATANSNPTNTASSNQPPSLDNIALEKTLSFDLLIDLVSAGIAAKQKSINKDIEENTNNSIFKTADIPQRLAAGIIDQYPATEVLAALADGFQKITLPESIPGADRKLKIAINILINLIISDKFGEYIFLPEVDNCLRELTFCLTLKHLNRDDLLANEIYSLLNTARSRANTFNNIKSINYLCNKYQQSTPVTVDFAQFAHSFVKSPDPSVIIKTAEEIRNFTVQFYYDLEFQQFRARNLSSKQKEIVSPQFMQYPKLASALTFFISQQILMQKTPRLRAKYWDFWLQVANKLLSFEDEIGPDLAGAKFVHAGLRGPIERLNKTSVHLKHKNIMEKLNDTFCSAQALTKCREIREQGALQCIGDFQTEKDRVSNTEPFKVINGYAVSNSTVKLLKTIATCHVKDLQSNILDYLARFHLELGDDEQFKENLDELSRQHEPSEFLSLNVIDNIDQLLLELNNRYHAQLHLKIKTKQAICTNQDAVTYLPEWLTQKKQELNTEKLQLFKNINDLKKNIASLQEPPPPEGSDEEKRLARLKSELQQKFQKYAFLQQDKNTIVGDKVQNARLNLFMQYFSKCASYNSEFQAVLLLELHQPDDIIDAINYNLQQSKVIKIVSVNNLAHTDLNLNQNNKMQTEIITSWASANFDSSTAKDLLEKLQNIGFLQDKVARPVMYSTPRMTTTTKSDYYPDSATGEDFAHHRQHSAAKLNVING